MDEVCASAACREVLCGSSGYSPKKIRAYGEASWNRWTRNRAVAGTVTKDARGREGLVMKFYVRLLFPSGAAIGGRKAGSK